VISYCLATTANAVHPHVTSVTEQFLRHVQRKNISCHREILFVVGFVFSFFCTDIVDVSINSTSTCDRCPAEPDTRVECDFLYVGWSLNKI
jgi:hypothetical protein